MPVVNSGLQILPVVEEEKIYPLVDQVIEIIQASRPEIRSWPHGNNH